MEEKRAALILLVLAAAGLLVRFWDLGGGAPGAVAFHPAGPSEPRDSVAARAARLARPLRRGERIDVDRAPAEELARLPRVGPGLAARIIDDREANGPFGSLEALDRVPGIGPATLQMLAPHVTFSGPAQAGGAVRASGLHRVSLNTASEAELAKLPGIGPVRARAIVADRRANGRYRSLEELARVPGIGPATLASLRGRVRVP